MVQQSKIRFDGVYCGSTEMGIRKYFRFYADGTVIEATTMADVGDIAPWFKKENFTQDHHSVGAYHVQPSGIAFSTTAPAYGTIRYRGTFGAGPDLQLESESLINGNQRQYLASFIAFPSGA